MLYMICMLYFEIRSQIYVWSQYLCPRREMYRFPFRNHNCIHIMNACFIYLAQKDNFSESFVLKHKQFFHFYICVCVYIYMYVYTYICMYVCIYICAYIYIYIYSVNVGGYYGGPTYSYIYVYILCFIFINTYICINNHIQNIYIKDSLGYNLDEALIKRWIIKWF